MAFSLIAQSDKTVGKVINFGSGKEISIKDLVEIICKIMKVKINVTEEIKRIRPEKVK